MVSRIAFGAFFGRSLFSYAAAKIATTQPFFPEEGNCADFGRRTELAPSPPRIGHFPVCFGAVLLFRNVRSERARAKARELLPPFVVAGLPAREFVLEITFFWRKGLERLLSYLQIRLRACRAA